MAGIVISSFDKFFKLFLSSMKGVNESVTTEMLTAFLLEADRFSNDCCSRLGGLIREVSNQPDVRETSEAVLIRIIRNRCFEPLDIILENYVEYLSQVQPNLKSVIDQLGDSRLRDVLKSLPNGQPLVQKRYKLPVAAKTAALLKMLDYLKSMQQLPSELMDYGSMRLFGAEADYEMVKRYLSNVEAAISELLGSATTLIEEQESVKRRRWEEQSASESAAINAVAMVSSMRYQKRKSGVGALLLGLLFTAPIWYISTTGTKNLYVGVTAGVCGLAAIFFFYRSVISFTKRFEH